MRTTCQCEFVQKYTKNGYQNEALGELINNITILAQTGGTVLRKRTKCPAEIK